MSCESDNTQRLEVLGQFVANVAHEINNPLGGILIYADLVLEDLEQDDIHRHNILKIIRETERCRKIVRGLLNFASHSQPCRMATDINDVISEALCNIIPRVQSQNIRIIEQYGKLPLIPVDSSQIQEVFENLLLNAVEALSDSGDILITTMLNGVNGKNRHVRITVSDTGPGIAEECIDTIFKPFVTLKQAGHGTGLGLAASYRIVNNHNGTITAENRPEGGALFTVCLPTEGS